VLQALQRNRLWLFYALAFPLSWYPWLLALARGRTSGPNPLGPLVAALLVTALVDRWSGVRALLARLVRWRVGPSSYLAVFAVPVALAAGSAALAGAGALHGRLVAGISPRETLTRFAFILLFVGLGEEPGWRGFALEQLQRRRSPLAASLMLAPVWALWHLPLMGNEFPWPVVAPFVLSVVGGTLFQTWLYNRTRGSLLLQMLLHATVNTFGAGIVFPAYSGAAQVTLWWCYGIGWLLVGAVAIRFAASAPQTIGSGREMPAGPGLSGSGRAALSIGLLIALTTVASLRAQEPVAAPADRFGGRLAPCAAEGLKEPALCGDLEVWENRAAKAGRRIPIHVLVLPARGPEPAPDPVFYFEGGPGLAGTTAAAEIGGRLDALRWRRDLVFFDQRGIGASNGLACELGGSPENLQGYIRGLFPRAALAACLPQLERRADLSQYGSDEAMDDVDDVRAWLGYERINLFGISYGSMAAQVYLRRHPEHVRSVTLMGVGELDTRMPLEFARAAQQSLDRVLDDCGTEPACHAAFPDPRADLERALATLGQAPATAKLKRADGVEESVSLTRAAFVATLRALLYSPSEYPQIPVLLHRAAAGDWAPMAARAVEYEASLSDDSIGLYLTVTCPEATHRIDPAEVPGAVAGTFLGDSRVREQMAACAIWPRRAVPPEDFEPVRSTVPALLISGWLDPATPPEEAARVASGFPASLHVVIRDGAHGPFGLPDESCAWGLIERFVAAGAPFDLDTSCVATMHRRPFDREPDPFDPPTR